MIVHERMQENDHKDNNETNLLLLYDSCLLRGTRTVSEVSI